MDYSQFLHMREELSLVAVLLLLFLADLFMSPDAHKQKGTRPVLNTMLPVILMAIHTAINLVPGTAADIFGGMYHYVPMHTVVKSILNIGTLIVFLMAHEWMKRDDTSFKQGEFYVLTLSTLFGMYLMISAGHFLMFFIGLETASIPMAALIAFDKYRHNSAEAGAKYILTALFSSALLLFGLSMIYGSAGTLYFDDLPAIASITIANIFAIRQQNLKRLMAFSSISQAGYIMLGVIGGTAQGMTAMVYYILVYAAANLGVFAVITIVALRSQKFTLEDYAGLYKTNPKMAFLMTISLFSLAGIPPFAGFFSKFFIFMAAFEAGFHLLVFIALVNTVISLYYYLLIVKAMYITPSDNPIPTFRSDRCTKWGLALCTLGIIGLGIASIVYQSIDKLSFGI